VPLPDDVTAFLERTVRLYGTHDAGETVEAIFTEDAIYHDHRPMLAGAVSGRAALTNMLRTTLEMLPDFRISIHVLAVDGRRYLARDTYAGHAALGGGEAEMQWWVVDELRDGRLAREDIYETEEEARAEFERRVG
jgi:limonene-1,2-epoxide hydrolase